jgi:hypothetical protein
MGRMTVSPSELNLFFRVQYHTGFDMIDIWAYMGHLQSTAENS